MEDEKVHSIILKPYKGAQREGLEISTTDEEGNETTYGTAYTLSTALSFARSCIKDKLQVFSGSTEGVPHEE